MFRFDKEQIVLDVAGLKVGGQPGEYPTVIAGNHLLRWTQNNFRREGWSLRQRKKAEGLIKKQEEMSDVTG